MKSHFMLSIRRPYPSLSCCCCCCCCRCLYRCSHLGALFVNCQGYGEWILLALISCKVYDGKGARTKRLTDGLTHWLTDWLSLTSCRFSCVPSVHVKQIFIALFYLHFLYWDPDIFSFTANLLCRFFSIYIVYTLFYYYLTFRFILSL